MGIRVLKSLKNVMPDELKVIGASLIRRSLINNRLWGVILRSINTCRSRNGYWYNYVLSQKAVAV